MIEQAHREDHAAVSELDRLVLGNDSRREELAHAIEAGQCYVWRSAPGIGGFAVLDRSFFGQYFLALVIVHPEFSRHGVASALIGHLESVCPGEKLFTSTNQSNLKMQNLCAKLGYVRSGIIENLDEGDPELIYFKRL